MHYRDELLRIEKELTERKSDLLYELGGLPAGEACPRHGLHRFSHTAAARPRRPGGHRSRHPDRELL